MGSDDAQVVSLENDDQVMVLFTEIRAIHKDNDVYMGYWVDVNPQNNTLLKKRLHGLPMSSKDSFMFLCFGNACN